jgi:class 3 adenylate cyclase/tetratricopeptide (TPR) repeat protein
MSKLITLFLTLLILFSCDSTQKNKITEKAIQIPIPVISNNYLDSLYNEYESLKTDDEKNKFFELLFVPYPFSADSSLRILDSTIQELRWKNDLERLKLFLEVKAIYFSRKKEFKKALILYDSCILLESKSGNMNFLGHLYERQELIYWRMNLNQLRVKLLFKAIEYYKKAGNLVKQGEMYFSIGNIFFLNQQYDKACQAYVERTQMEGDCFNQAMGWIFAARCLIKTGNLKLAGEYIYMGTDVIHSPTLYHPFYYYSTYGTWLCAMNKKEEALRNFKIAVPLAVKGGQLYQKANTLADIAEIYIDLKNFDNAKINLMEAIKIVESVDIISTKVKVKRVLAKYYESTGQDKKALVEYKIWMGLNDSMNHKEVSSALEGSTLESEFNEKNAQRDKDQQKIDEAEKEKLRKQKLITYSSLISLLFIGIIAFLFWRNNQQQKKANSIISAEKQRSDNLLLNILPHEVAEELKAKGSADAKHFDMVTVLFTDFKDFTQISETMTATELVEELNVFFKAFDNIITKLNIEKIKTIGDSYMCVGGLPFPSDSHATAVVYAGLEIQKFVEQHSSERLKKGLIPLQIRIGIHSGPVVAGIVGLKKYAYDIWGDTVNTASRMESSGEAGKINISGSTYELIKDDFTCTPRGKVMAKNKGEVEMYFVDCKI